MIDQYIIFQILYFLFNSDKLIRIADGIAQQADKSIDGLHGTLSVILVYEPFDTCQRIINVMGINLHLQGLDFRFSASLLCCHQFIDIILQVIQHIVIGSCQFLYFRGSFHRHILFKITLAYLPHTLYQLGQWP